MSDYPNYKSTATQQKEIIANDISKINDVLNSNDEQELQNMHQYIDGKYHSYVPDWGYSMYGYMDGFGFNYEFIGITSFIHNLKQMKSNLEGFMCGFKIEDSKVGQSNSVNVNVNNTNNNSNTITLSVSFEQVRSQIEEMTSLTDEQTQEALDKITEIENAINGSGTKKSKWEKIKPVLVWLADKSFDVGMTLLPLLLKI